MRQIIDAAVLDGECVEEVEGEKEIRALLMLMVVKRVRMKRAVKGWTKRRKKREKKQQA